MCGLKVVKKFRGGLVFKAHRCWHHPTLGLRVIRIKKKKIRVRPLLSETETTLKVLKTFAPKKAQTKAIIWF